jgi:glycosyltransferase involved in cell wall biosynthesis
MFTRVSPLYAPLPPTLPQMPATVDLTVFVACYNEAPNIVATLETVAAAAQDVGCSYEIIVIDDASVDESVPTVREFQRAHPELPIVLRRNPVNRGLARNFVAAAFLGRGTYFKLVCGDNVESQETLVRILSQMGRADVILSYHQKCLGRGWGRRALSWTYTRLVNVLSGHHIHYYNGLPLYRREQVLRWHSRTRGFGFQADLVTRLLDQGASHLEVLVEARERSHGRSTALTFHNFLAVGRTLLGIGLRRIRRLLRVG